MWMDLEIVILSEVSKTEKIQYCVISLIHGSSQRVLVLKNLLVNSGDIRDTGSVPGSGRFPGGGHVNPLQYSCLENPMDRGLLGYGPIGLKGSDTTEVT